MACCRYTGLFWRASETASSRVRSGLAGAAVCCATATGARQTTVSAASSEIRIGGEVLESGSPARTEGLHGGFHPIHADRRMGRASRSIYRKGFATMASLVRFGSQEDLRADLFANVRIDRGALLGRRDRRATDRPRAAPRNLEPAATVSPELIARHHIVLCQIHPD